MSEAPPLAPRPWRTDLNIEAGVVYDATGAVVLVVDPFSDRTTDAEVHAIAAFVVDCVNRMPVVDVPAAVWMAVLQHLASMQLGERHSLSDAVSGAFQDLKAAGEVPVSVPGGPLSAPGPRVAPSTPEGGSGQSYDYDDDDCPNCFRSKKTRADCTRCSRYIHEAPSDELCGRHRVDFA